VKNYRDPCVTLRHHLPFTEQSQPNKTPTRRPPLYRKRTFLFGTTPKSSLIPDGPQASCLTLIITYNSVVWSCQRIVRVRFAKGAPTNLDRFTSSDSSSHQTSFRNSGRQVMKNPGLAQVLPLFLNLTTSDQIFSGLP